MTEVHLSIRPNTGICVALHILPMGVSYRGMHSVCLHSVRLCALSGGAMSVTASLEAISRRRPSVCFVLTSPALTVTYRPISSEKVYNDFWETVFAYFLLFQHIIIVIIITVIHLFHSVLFTCEHCVLLISDKMLYALHIYGTLCGVPVDWWPCRIDSINQTDSSRCFLPCLPLFSVAHMSWHDCVHCHHLPTHPTVVMLTDSDLQIHSVIITKSPFSAFF